MTAATRSKCDVTDQTHASDAAKQEQNDTSRSELKWAKRRIRQEIGIGVSNSRWRITGTATVLAMALVQAEIRYATDARQ